MQRETPEYTVDDDGRIHFTEAGREELRHYFGRVGIDIRTIRTWEDYLKARKQASPFFMEYLSSIARRGPMTAERRLLISAVEDDEETFQESLRKFDARRRLRVVDSESDS
jgi:hypothetical protein